MQNFIGEIRCFPYPGLVPSGWHACDGSLLSISSNPALYSLIGSNFGGDGRSTFALPDLRGRVMMGISPSHRMGQAGGAETVTLLEQNMPAHSHGFGCVSAPGAVGAPLNNTFSSAGGQFAQQPLYAAPSGNPIPLNPASLSAVGADGEHYNMQPYLVAGLYIALHGIYPQRS